jgi:hypothetical protein
MAEPRALTHADIRRLFELLNQELERKSVVGEVYLVGGAVMCLALDARPATRDVDAFFRPTREVRQAAARVGSSQRLDRCKAAGCAGRKGLWDRCPRRAELHQRRWGPS